MASIITRMNLAESTHSLELVEAHKGMEVRLCGIPLSRKETREAIQLMQTAVGEF